MRHWSYADGVPALVRPAAAPDVPSIAGIYGQAVRTSIATFDLTDPPTSYWERKISSSVSGNHLLVVEDGPEWSDSPPLTRFDRVRRMRRLGKPRCTSRPTRSVPVWAT